MHTIQYYTHTCLRMQACMQIHADNFALLGFLPLRWPELPEPRDIGGGQGLPVQPATLPWKTSSPEVIWGELPSIPLIPPAVRPPSLEALPGVCGCCLDFVLCGTLSYQLHITHVCPLEHYFWDSL